MANNGTWCRFSSGVRDHEKTKALAERLGLPIYAAGGLLAFLWAWSVEHGDGENGSITDYSIRAIEKACAWDGRRGALVEALRVCGFLDGKPDSEQDPLRIHDWDEYNGAILEHRRKQADKKHEQREKEKLEKLKKQGAGDVSPVVVPGDVSGGTVPLPTVTVTETVTHTDTENTEIRIPARSDLTVEGLQAYYHQQFRRSHLPEEYIMLWQGGKKEMSLEAIKACIDLAKAKKPKQGWEALDLVRKTVDEKRDKGLFTVEAILKDQG